jgi:hypothetical protein
MWNEIFTELNRPQIRHNFVLRKYQITAREKFNLIAKKSIFSVFLFACTTYHFMMDFLFFLLLPRREFSAGILFIGERNCLMCEYQPLFMWSKWVILRCLNVRGAINCTIAEKSVCLALNKWEKWKYTSDIIKKR